MPSLRSPGPTAVTGKVTVEFQTLNGTATNFIHYRTNWTRLTFNGGDTVKTVVVTNINDNDPAR